MLPSITTNTSADNKKNQISKQSQATTHVRIHVQAKHISLAFGFELTFNWLKTRLESCD